MIIHTLLEPNVLSAWET